MRCPSAFAAWLADTESKGGLDEPGPENARLGVGNPVSHGAALSTAVEDNAIRCGEIASVMVGQVLWPQSPQYQVAGSVFLLGPFRGVSEVTVAQSLATMSADDGGRSL